MILSRLLLNRQKTVSILLMKLKKTQVETELNKQQDIINRASGIHIDINGTGS